VPERRGYWQPVCGGIANIEAKEYLKWEHNLIALEKLTNGRLENDQRFLL
jgi:hypothetical protein